MDKFSREYYQFIQTRLYSAVIADTLDSLGCRNQTLRHDLRLIFPEARMAGRAATMRTENIDHIPAEPYKLELALLDSLKPGEVVVCASGGSSAASLWGELLSTCAVARGSRGVLIDGLTRDAAKIIEMRFPVFALGFIPTDSKGRIETVAIRQRVQIGTVQIDDGDLIVADLDGCVVVPQAIEDQVIEKARAKVSAENTVRDLLAQGASIQQVFREHGVL